MMLKELLLLYLLAKKTSGHEPIIHDDNRNLRLARDSSVGRQLAISGTSCAEQNSCVDFTLEEVLSSGTGCPAGSFTCQYKVCAKYKNGQCPVVFRYVGRDSVVSPDVTQCFGATTNICSKLEPFPTIGHDTWCVIANPDTQLSFVLSAGAAGTTDNCATDSPELYTYKYGTTDLNWICEINSISHTPLCSTNPLRECAWFLKTPPIDTIAPVLENVPKDATITSPPQECGGPDTVGVTAKDNLDNYALVEYTDGPPIGKCVNQKFTCQRTWTAIDHCGNVGQTQAKVVTMVDKIPPVLTWQSQDDTEITVECEKPIPDKPPTVKDNCDPMSNPKIIKIQLSGSSADCGKTITRTYTASDSCNNLSALIQKIVVGPRTGPKKTFCFSASNSVNVQGKGLVSMKNLQVGDMVQTNNHHVDSFSRVMSFLHIDHDTKVDYLQIHTDALDMPLEITPDHFLFVDEHQTVRAQDVKVGDKLGDGTVTSIQSVKRQGLYAPATQSGEIMVSGTPVSCYIDLLDGMAPSLQAAAMHAALAPLRFVCGYDFSICKQETYTDGGISSNLGQLFELGNMLADGTSLMQWLVVIACVPALLGLLALEMMLTHGKLITLALGGYFFVHQKK